MRWKLHTWTLLLILLVAFAGCKKDTKEADKNQKKTAKQDETKPPVPEGDSPATEPAEPDEAEPPVTQGDSPEADVVEQDLAEPAEGDVAESPPEQPKTDSGEGEGEAAEKDEPRPSGSGHEAEKVDSGEGDGTESAEADEAKPLVPQGDSPEGEGEGEEENPHFGREFNLDAIMLISELVQQPEYYAGLGDLKLMANVVAVKGNMAVLEMKTRDGPSYLMALQLDVAPEAGVTVGQKLYVEGKLTNESWDPAALGLADPSGLEGTTANTDWLFIVEAGEKTE